MANISPTPNGVKTFFKLPAALKPLAEVKHWLVWRYEPTAKGKPTKVPYQAARPAYKAATDKPHQWSDFAMARPASQGADVNGIGFCLLDSGYGAFDIDNCRIPSTKAIHPWALQLVERANSYTEVSPSGTGLRIIGRCSGSQEHRKQPVPGTEVSLESYGSVARYITITGDQLKSSPNEISDITALLAEMVTELDEANGTAAKTARSETVETDGGGHQIVDWDKVEPFKIADLAADFNKKGRAILAFDGTQLKDLVLDLKQADVLQKAYASWSEVPIALAAIGKHYGLSGEQIAAMLLAPLPCNKHINGLATDALKRRQVERALKHSHEPSTPRVARLAPWRECYEDGSPRASFHNACVAINAIGVVCSYDTFHGKLIVGFADGAKHELPPDLGDGIDDTVVICLRTILSNRFDFDLGSQNVREAMVSLAHQHRFDPVVEMLAKAQAEWDGVKRLERMAVTHVNAADTELNRAVIKTVMVGAVRRARKPGCKFDTIVILESPEGWNKSKLWNILAGPENFSDASILGHSGKEVMEALANIWIHENADLAGMRKADIDQIKAFASRSVDQARPAYGYFTVKQPRHSIDVGTTNAEVYLQSSTGNRRFWPMKVLKCIDEDLIRRDRLQLWGEAAAVEATIDGDIILPPHLWAKAAIEQEARRARDAWEDEVERILTGDVGHYGTEYCVTIHRINGIEGDLEVVNGVDLLSALLHGRSAVTNDQMRLSNVMRLAGWSRGSSNGKFSINGKRIRGFCRTPDSI